jgi:hypothetical protein
MAVEDRLPIISDGGTYFDWLKKDRPGRVKLPT